MERPVLLDNSLKMPGVQGAAARLQHLGLISYDLPGVKATAAPAMEARLLPYLSCLNSLALRLSTDSDRAPPLLLPHISTLVRLQELSLWIEGEEVPAATLPDILRLTALRSLGLSGCDLEPSCLLPITTGLTGFTLNQVTICPRQAQQDSELGTSQLLQLLARLTALQELALDNLSADWPQQLSAHSALTASSNLRELRVMGCGRQTAAWAHMLHMNQKLLSLHTFTCCSDLFPAGCRVAIGDQPQHCLDSSGIDSLVSCCPALRDLQISIQPGADLAPLHSLTALTSLGISPVKPAAIRSDLAAMDQLQRLQLVLSLPAPGKGVADPATATGASREAHGPYRPDVVEVCSLVRPGTSSAQHCG